MDRSHGDVTGPLRGSDPGGDPLDGLLDLRRIRLRS
jgi:hypothetical protein